jgi:hypothetical protein
VRLGEVPDVRSWRLLGAALVVAVAAAGTTFALLDRSADEQTTTTTFVNALLRSLTEETRSTFAAGYACNPVQGLAAGVAEPYCTNPSDIKVYSDGILVRTRWSISATTRTEARALCVAVAESLPEVPVLDVRVDGRGGLLLAWSSAAGTRRCSSA